VTARASLLGLLITPLNTYVVVSSNFAGIWYIAGVYTLFENAVAALFLLCLANLALKRFSPRHVFSRGEMLTIYLMLSFGTALVCAIWEFGANLPGVISYPFWFATNGNRWGELLWPTLPSWLTVQDDQALRDFWVGGASIYRLRALGVWLDPALWWAAIVGGIMWVCLCLNSIVRRRWEDEEKLPFPIATLPVQLADERFALLRSKLFWVGLGVAAGHTLWNGVIVRFIPNMFVIPNFFDYGPWVANHHPWEFIRYRDFTFGPWEFGLCYLMPLDMMLSLIVFDLLWMGEYVLAGYLGWAMSPSAGIPYGERQVAGAVVAIFVVTFLLDRRYLVQVLRKALGLLSVVRDESGEAFSYRTAVLGAVAGGAFLWWVFVRAGMQSWVAIVFLLVFFLVCLVLTRIRAQVGPPSHELQDIMPDTLLRTIGGDFLFTRPTLGVMALLRPYLVMQRNNPAPIQLEAMRMAADGRMERRRLAVVLAALAPIALLCLFWATLHLSYAQGMGSGKASYHFLSMPRTVTDELVGHLSYPAEPDLAGTAAIGVGFLVTLALMWLKLNIQWWPLHPIAFPIGLAWMTHSLLLAMFLTWLLKGLLLRYGGLRAHRAALPFFLGLLVGQATPYCVLRVVFMLLRVPPA
jgi:hypothetical protein